MRGVAERGFGTVSLLTVFAMAVHGYHPYAEDGGLYVAGVKRMLHPGMYGAHAYFVTEHLRYSLFAPMVASVTRVSRKPLEWVLLALYGVCVWATLYACWRLAARCTEDGAGRRGAVTLLACWLTLPVAGTSLMLTDPYLTARSVTTPTVLAALAWAMDAAVATRMQKRRWRGVAVAVAMIFAMTMHPLMAMYGGAGLLVLLALGADGSTRDKRKRIAWLGAAALGVAATVQVFAPAESSAYVLVERTRYYWFLSQWRWYERVGLAAPLLMLWGFARGRGQAGGRLLAQMALLLGSVSFVIAAAFARTGYATHSVARLQPLRCFQLVYVVMILLLGAWMGERVLGHKAWKWAAALAILGTPMFLVQRELYGSSDHLEWPASESRNAWARAFVWVRNNTPSDALFAMGAHYIQADGEDAQCFRAVAERDALPDYSKDGGEASLMPALTDDWMTGQKAQARLEQESDAQRTAALKPLGVTWVLLEAASATSWTCPYANARVKVCRLP